MKNVKVNLKKARKAGFSLVEMLVVIAIIGIIAAIAIPNIGNINDASRAAAAQRNAQQVASTWNAALAAGLGSDGVALPGTEVAILAALEAGVEIPPGGPFEGKIFTVGDIQNDTEAAVLQHLTRNPDGSVTYTK